MFIQRRADWEKGWMIRDEVFLLHLNPSLFCVGARRPLSLKSSNPDCRYNHCIQRELPAGIVLSLSGPFSFRHRKILGLEYYCCSDKALSRAFT